MTDSIIPVAKIKEQPLTNTAITPDNTLVDDTVALVDDTKALVGSLVTSIANIKVVIKSNTPQTRITPRR